MCEGAEFERFLIRERQRERIAIATKKGVYKGRNRALSVEQAKAVVAKDKANGGRGRAALAREVGVSRQTLYQYLRQAAYGAWSQSRSIEYAASQEAKAADSL